MNANHRQPLLATYHDTILCHLCPWMEQQVYNRDSVEDSTIYDLSANSNSMTVNGTLSDFYDNTASSWTKTPITSNTASNYFQPSDSSDFKRGTGNFSFIIVLRPSGWASTHYILGTKDTIAGVDAGFCLVDDNDGRMKFIIADGTTRYEAASSVNRVRGTSDWHIIICRKAPAGMSMQIDGDSNISVSTSGLGSLDIAREFTMFAHENTTYDQYADTYIAEFMFMGVSIGNGFFPVFRNYLTSHKLTLDFDSTIP